MSLISIGLSGLNASSAAMTTIGNNTANVGTLGYSRQQVMTSAGAQQNIGVGFIGTGTTLSDVRRIYNSFLDTQLQSSTSLNADAQAYLGQASKLDSILSDSSTGVSKVLSSFFTAMQAMSTDATNSAARNTFLKSAQSLSAQFNSISGQIKDQNTQINSQMTSVAGQVNSLASSVADLNSQIIQARASGNEPNSLLDAREEAVRQLNGLVGAKVVDNNGSYDIYIGTGQPLVTGNKASTLTAGPSDSDPNAYSLKVNYQNSSLDVTSVVTGGTLGGLVRYRSDVLQPAAKELGRLAIVVSDQINSQLNQGIDANGDFGANLFNSINDPSLTALRSLANKNNDVSSGNLAVSITNSGLLTTDDYQVTFSGVDAGGNATGYSVKVMPNGASLGPFSINDGAPKELTDRGFSLSFVQANSASGPATFKAGDSFQVSPTKTGADGIKTVMTDPKTLAAAAPLTGSVGDGNKGTGQFGQPVLVSRTDIYQSPAAMADMRNALKNSMPIRMVMGDKDATTGAQSFKLLDASGKPVLNDKGVAITGNITPGQSNPLSFKVGYKDLANNDQFYEFSMTVSGSPTSGDTYNIDVTGAGSSDNRNALTTLGLQTKQTVDIAADNGTGMSMVGANTHLISSVGAQAAQAKSDADATTAVVGQAKSARDSVSGVSMDEEAANLVKYQQYYTASSQIIKAAQAIFSTLINSL
ncbi:flagellar hook-associated protein FlgK [Pseudomonas abietaniphila]|uniref:Flagellar hook-associated protein 1 n=1 Tax=Pseudomonas abietaniphila TaxID=89065 RepID=A0A1G8S5P0_9PSED|nr:flagellar hook-associated protein FlgK [Pseudomonas abietaniphila]SDJ24497.1 flagellar hook-associated protein 1 FlgK [Pseudomonas abietaniphila]